MPQVREGGGRARACGAGPAPCAGNFEEHSRLVGVPGTGLLFPRPGTAVEEQRTG